MNSIVRNFIFVISRFKMASFLNVAGLSVAFTAFLILFMQIRYEWGYDCLLYTSDAADDQ